MTIRRSLTLILALWVLLATGCGNRGNPEYYKALDQAIAFLDDFSLPEASAIEGENAEYGQALGEFSKLSKEVENTLDGNVVEKESYQHFSDIGALLIKFTREYKIAEHYQRSGEEYDFSGWEKTVEESHQELERKLAALKEAVKAEQGQAP